MVYIVILTGMIYIILFNDTCLYRHVVFTYKCSIMLYLPGEIMIPVYEYQYARVSEMIFFFTLLYIEQVTHRQRKG